ncbi:alpha/beta fold hydrolase, partial [Phenylobacterium sp.]|uniref:alpha/beta fold hydrolase n=1 Tax=Phenylobacterium sp. TaxID=1871053 RepID=UPI002EDB06FE
MTDPTQSSPDALTRVRHKRLQLDGAGVFYREAGPADAPVLLLPHGYPCSSFEFRNYMPALADRWRLLAPDFPGCGLSDDPEGFAYDFDGYAAFLQRFLDALDVQRFAIYLHDFGSQIGLRLAIQAPERVAALILQNGDIYEDALGPKYQPLLELLALPQERQRAELAKAVSEEEFRAEFLNDVRPEL